MVFTLDDSGRQLTLEEYYDYARSVLLESAKGPDELRALWIDPSLRRGFLRDLAERGVHPSLLAEIRQLPEADGFDILATLAFGVEPKLRQERVEAFLNRRSDWLNAFGEEERSIILELLDAYEEGGASELDDRRLLQLHRFEPYGGVLGVVRRFGSAAVIDETLRTIVDGLYEEAA
jgi:hypothetical protein